MSIFTITKSSLSLSCPKCRKGQLFKVKNPYKFNSLFEMNQQCTNCKANFSPEPRFYDGAMFITYALIVVLVSVVFVISIALFEDPNAWYMSAVTIALATLFSPITLRLSRSIWIHIFVKYDENYK